MSKEYLLNLKGPDDDDSPLPPPAPLNPGEVQVFDLGDGIKIVVVGTNEGDKIGVVNGSGDSE